MYVVREMHVECRMRRGGGLSSKNLNAKKYRSSRSEWTLEEVEGGGWETSSQSSPAIPLNFFSFLLFSFLVGNFVLSSMIYLSNYYFYYVYAYSSTCSRYVCIYRI